MRTIVHVSDLHFGRIDQHVVAELLAGIQRVQPNLVAVSGDLTQRARRREFVAAREFLDALPFPQLVVPGNHDVPLYNLARRFLQPLTRYRRYITDDLEPMYTDEEVVVLGLNSARAWTFGGSGRLSASQIKTATERLRTVPREALKIIVTHHPFDLPPAEAAHRVIGGARAAMAELASVGADLFLAGHLHLIHIGNTTERYNIEGHCALVVQAGTLSQRLRGDPHSFNVIELSRPHIRVTHHNWDEQSRAFLPTAVRKFRHGAGGWSEEA